MKVIAKIVLAAAGLLAAASAVSAAPPAVAAEPGLSITRQLALVSYPGVRLADTLADGMFEVRADRMEAVTIPGIAPRNVFADRLHWVLGLATVLAGGVTGLTGGEGDDDGGSAHHVLGYVSAGLAAATLATGFWAHHGDVGPSDGFSPANVHALLGIAGGLMMAATPFLADFGGGESHAALGIGGELLMGIAVVWPLVF